MPTALLSVHVPTSGACDEVCGHVSAHDFKHRGLDVLVGDSLDVSIAHLLVPDLVTRFEQETAEGVGMSGVESRNVRRCGDKGYIRERVSRYTTEQV